VYLRHSFLFSRLGSEDLFLIFIELRTSSFKDYIVWIKRLTFKLRVYDDATGCTCTKRTGASLDDRRYHICSFPHCASNLFLGPRGTSSAKHVLVHLIGYISPRVPYNAEISRRDERLQLPTYESSVYRDGVGIFNPSITTSYPQVWTNKQRTILTRVWRAAIYFNTHDSSAHHKLIWLRHQSREVEPSIHSIAETE